MIRFVLISFDDSDAPGTDLRTAFDLKLEEALVMADCGAAVIHLRADMAPSIELLEWLEGWTRRFTEATRRCIIVPQTAEQLECLELSHPDQNLIYAPSIAELDAFLPPMSVPYSAGQGAPEGDPQRSGEHRETVPDPVFEAEATRHSSPVRENQEPSSGTEDAPDPQKNSHLSESRPAPLAPPNQTIQAAAA